MPTDDDELDDAPETAEKGFGEEPVDPEEVGRWRRFARRFMDRKELAEDTRDLLTAFLSTSDKAKSELVRMAGREVRHYLDGLRLKEDLLDVATNYRLEVHATFHLEPIAKAMKGSSKAEPKAQVKGEVRPNAASKARDDGAADEEDDEG
ncbi:MAG: hypothetical protein H6737_24925 [Alphaproteobacteria bacterium]|nr:hypothetical protein [Alphaproteobacteria bacterium]